MTSKDEKQYSIKKIFICVIERSQEYYKGEKTIQISSVTTLRIRQKVMYYQLFDIFKSKYQEPPYKFITMGNNLTTFKMDQMMCGEWCVFIKIEIYIETSKKYQPNLNPNIEGKKEEREREREREREIV